MIVTGKICIYKHPSGHVTLFWENKVGEMSLIHDGELH